MKKVIRYSLILLALIIVGTFIAYIWIENNLNQLARTQVTTIDLNSISDGVYEGDYQSFPIDVEVKVLIQEHKIVEIELIKHVTGQGQNAEAIIDEVVKHNSIDVDVISGATYSSKVILQAISNAVNGE